MKPSTRTPEGDRQGEFTLLDFKKQLRRITTLGPIQKVMSMIPGMGGLSKMLGGNNLEADLRRLVGIIDSMTPDERRNFSKTIDQSRRRRIAAGAGVEPYQVNDLVKQFDGMADIMKKLADMGFTERMKTIQQLGSSDMLNPNAKFAKHVKRTGRRLTPEEIIRRLRKLRDDEDKA